MFLKLLIWQQLRIYDPHVTQLSFLSKWLLSALGCCLSCSMLWHSGHSLPVFKTELYISGNLFTPKTSVKTWAVSISKAWAVFSNFWLVESIDRSGDFFLFFFTMLCNCVVTSLCITWVQVAVWSQTLPYRRHIWPQSFMLDLFWTSFSCPLMKLPAGSGCGSMNQ